MMEFSSIPRLGLAACLVPGLLSATIDLAPWTNDGRFDAVDYAGLVVLMLSWITAGYVAAITMIGRPLSVLGAGRFLLTSLLTIAPVIVGLVLLSRTDRDHPNGWTLLAPLVAIGFGLLLLALLPAWPVVAAASGKLVNPTRVLAATKGNRWALISISFVASSLNKLVPSIATATSQAETVGLALAGGLISVISLMLAVSTAVAASKFASEQDSGLLATYK